MTDVLLGRRCVSCSNATPNPNARRCVDCGSALVEASLPQTGTVWSSTVVHTGAAPTGLSYVDLAGGPRVLARFDLADGKPVSGEPAVIEMRDGLPYVRGGAS